jgi:hypothetical protein
LNEKAFSKYLSKKNVSEKQAINYISRLNEFDKFLTKNNYDIDSIPKGEIINYSDDLVKKITIMF